MKRDGLSSINIGSIVDGQMGQQPPARRARARQHRLDGERRQDRCAQDRDQEPADQLKNAATNNGDVYVSIIPFSKDVNVGTSNHSATWLQWDDGTDKSWDGTNGTCSKSGGYSPRSACTSPGLLLAVELHQPEHLHLGGTCSALELTPAKTLAPPSGRLLQSRPDGTRASCTTKNACTNAALHAPETLPGQWRHLGAWDLDPGRTGRPAPGRPPTGRRRATAAGTAASPIAAARRRPARRPATTRRSPHRPRAIRPPCSTPSSTAPARPR